jgi:hypothetical protein
MRATCTRRARSLPKASATTRASEPCFDREALAHTHASALAQSVDRIVLGMAERPTDLTIAVDGTELGAGTLGTPLPLDPGRHVIEASAAGKQSRAITVSLGASGNTERIDIPDLEDIRVAPSASEPRASAGVARQSIGYVVGAAGIVILGVAAYFDAMALSKDNQSKAASAVTGPPLYHDAQRDQAVAQIALGVGVAALGSGVILAFWPPASRTAPQAATQTAAQMAMRAVSKSSVRRGRCARTLPTRVSSKSASGTCANRPSHPTSRRST